MRVCAFVLFSLILLVPFSVFADSLIDWSLFDLNGIILGNDVRPPVIHIPPDTSSLEICPFLTYMIDTPDNSMYEWSSSNEPAVMVYRNGSVMTFDIGDSIVTGHDNTQSNDTIQITFSAPMFYLSDTDILVDTPDGSYFIAQLNAYLGLPELVITGDSFQVSFIEDRHGRFPCIYHVVPVSEGSGSIEFLFDNETIGSIHISVTESALTGSPSNTPIPPERAYPDFNYISSFISPESFTGNTYLVSGNVQSTLPSQDGGMYCLVSTTYDGGNCVIVYVPHNLELPTALYSDARIISASVFSELFQFDNGGLIPLLIATSFEIE